jgi:phage major head subunit gpT-like protein
MAINTGQIQNLLRPGLAAVFGDYPMYPSQWSEIFDVYESDKQVEIEVEMKMLGLAQIRQEGSQTAMDSMGQRIITNYVHKYVGLGFAITRQAIMDNLYKTRFPMMAKALRDSLAQTKEILGASVMNNAFNTSYPIGDGQPLCSTAHPIDGGTFANKPTVAADLNEASLESAIIAIQQFKNQAGLIVQTKPKKLLVAPQNQFTAERLLASAFRTNTANNDVSAIYNVTAIPDAYRVNQFFVSTNGLSWFVKTDAPDGFKHYQREKVETDVYTDFSTDNLMCKAIERYSFGVSNPRSVYGSNPTS